jgi:ATP-dependent RNA helicase DDX27
LVVDEADRLLEMGFAEEIKEIVRMSPTKRQTLLFSATMTEEVNALVALSLRHPVRLAADAAAASPASLRQEVVRLKGSGTMKKEATLLALVSRSFASSGRCIIFFSTKQRAHRAKILFGFAGLPTAAELHGDMTQAARLESLERFRQGEVAFLLATDVAARGLDILGVEVVINYDCPKNLASYLHRVGRTARAGSNGLAVVFAEDGDRNLLKEVVKKGGVDLQQRVVPAPAIASWYEKISGMESQVGDVLGEEREEKELRRAEMEAQKAENMIEHETEIYSRPARTWFQSGKEKKDIAAQAKDSMLNVSIQKKIDKNAAKSARRMERKIATSKEEATEKQHASTGVKSGMVRALKAREAALREEGIPASRASRIAASMVAGPKKQAVVAKSKGAGGLFAGDGVKESNGGGAGTRVYAGGARSGKARPSTELGKSMHKKKNKSKGKSRHKRR